MDKTAPSVQWSDIAASLAPGLLRLALMLTGSASLAEDLLQTTYERAQRHASRIVTMDHPGAYLRTIMMNAHIKTTTRKQLQTVPLAQAEALASPSPTPSPAPDDDIWSCLTALPKQQRAVLVLRFYEDLDDSEIAELIGCSPVTVRSHASRAFATLRTHLTQREVS